jgi:hypothetical protein
VREVIANSKTTARKLGLGAATGVRIEGAFGTLLVSPGEYGSSAMWVNGESTRAQEQLLRELANAAGEKPESES